METARTTANCGPKTQQFTICNLQFAICNRRRRAGFTLVELLVVITIIGILAALITAAGAGALRTARQNAIKTELDQITMGLQTYKDSAGSYPPNCQTDGNGSDAPLDESQVLTDLKRHLKQAFPRHREPESLLSLIAGQPVSGNKELPGGMTAGEALVFWLGGFSDDPKYPISGEGGPSYLASDGNLDPVENRKWTYPFEVARLGPRDTENYFDEDEGERYIEYQVTIPGQNGNSPQTRRINFWQYTPARAEQPFLYFDTSRHPPQPQFDPPAATLLTGLGDDGEGLHVHAIKMLNQSAGAGDLPIIFANADKFQVLHCGIDGEWGEEAFEKMSYHGVEDIGDPNVPDDYLLYPDGPFTGDVADTLVNFSENTLEASQP